MTETTEAETTQAAPAPALWEDFVDVHYAPGQVFERRRDGRWLPAVIVLAVLVTALTVLMRMSMADVLRTTMLEQMPEATAAQITPEQMDRMSGGSPVVAAIGALLITPVAVVVGGLVIWGVAALFGASMGFATGAVVAAYSAFPRVWALVATILQGGLLDPTRMSDVSVGPARFLGPDASPLVLGVLTRLDVFTLWGAALVAIGVATVGRIGFARAVAVALLVWALGTLPVLLPALIFG